jgi:hypothetical protein
MDESLSFVLNEDNGSTMFSKANLSVEKNPKILKTTMQILKQMKLISSKQKHAYIMNGSFGKKNLKEALDKTKTKNEKKLNTNKNKLNKMDSFGTFHENLKDTRIYVCICCERFYFFSKSTVINVKIKNKTNNIINYNLQTCSSQKKNNMFVIFV